MELLNLFKYHSGENSELKMNEWISFLQRSPFSLEKLTCIDLTDQTPTFFDLEGNKFSINFELDRRNYQKKKSSLKKELIARAMGSGRAGMRILDLSAGLGIDAVFLSQMGFEVTAIERNAFIFLALNDAIQNSKIEMNLKFFFDSAQNYLQKNIGNHDVIYFDPMFPDKKKSALPKQEMVFFRNLVGADEDAENVLELALQRKEIHRVVVKRPIKAPSLLKKPDFKVEGKLVRFDVYGVHR